MRYFWEIAFVAFVWLWLAAAARAEDLCNLSWCVDPELEWSGAGFECPDGAQLDFGRNPRELRWGDVPGCPPGAWGISVEDPNNPGFRVPIHDRLVTCSELSRLCPAAPIHPEAPVSGAPILVH